MTNKEWGARPSWDPFDLTDLTPHINAIDEAVSQIAREIHDQRAEVADANFELDEVQIARLITGSVAGGRWRDLQPLDIARHLVSNGVRVVVAVEPMSEMTRCANCGGEVAVGKPHRVGDCHGPERPEFARVVIDRWVADERQAATPTRPVPDEQTRAFRLAVCERLGIDPSIVIASTFRVGVPAEDDDEPGTVTLTACFPADELVDMWNTAGRQASREAREP